ncbi:MAG TPA: hypothetical protein VIA64_15435 [Burkholderiales bacterium]|jgi:hypothetical protein
MPVLIALTAVIQAFFVFHVYRTGRPYWWAFIILSFPVIGCVAYYALEVFPGSREHRSARRAANQVARAFNPTGGLKARLEALAVCPSVANKIAAADEFMRCGVFGEAVRLYRDALTGPHADDPNLLLGLARAHVNDGTLVEAQEALARLRQLDARYRPEEARLLMARTHEGLGETEQALAEYEEVAQVYIGLEAKCRYGMLLKQLGFAVQANSVFKEMLEHAKRFKVNLDTERPWIDTARRNLMEAA